MILSPQELALQARISILNMTSRANASHVGSCLSVVDILSVIYSKVQDWSDLIAREKNRHSNHLILSKGHAAAALYSILSLKELIPTEWLNRYCENGSELGGHVTSKGIPAITLSTGSLGHGLPYALGIALGKKRSGEDGRIFVVMSDGECDEGTTWESALFANHHKLDNLFVFIDRNRLQSLTTTEETLALEPLEKKWSSFGWEVREVDGHNYDQLSQALAPSDYPVCVIANTIKGKGVSFMENSVLWHYRPPNSEDLKIALSELIG